VIYVNSKNPITEFFSHPTFKIDDPEESEHYKEIVKSLPVLIIDYAKCTDALSCLTCIQVCPTKVFALVPPRGKGRFVEERRVIPYMPELCVSCNQCVEKCPKNAISIKP
jgi:ferredoxin